MRRDRILRSGLWVAAVLAAGAMAQDAPLLGPLGPDVVPVPPVDATTRGETGSPASVASKESLPLGQAGADVVPLRTVLRDQADRPGGAEPGVRPLAAGEGWWRTAGALALVIAIVVLLGVAVRALGRRGGGLLGAIGPGGRAPAGILQVLGRYPIGRGQTLLLLKLDRRVLLLCQSFGARAGGARTLCELTDPEEVASMLAFVSEADGRSLGAKFREAVSRFETSHEAAEAVLAPVSLGAGEPLSCEDPVGELRTRLVRLRGVGTGGGA